MPRPGPSKPTDRSIRTIGTALFVQIGMFAKPTLLRLLLTRVVGHGLIQVGPFYSMQMAGPQADKHKGGPASLFIAFTFW